MGPTPDQCSQNVSVGPRYQQFFSLSFLGPHLGQMEVPRLGVESELQLPACITATGYNLGSELCLRPTPQLTATLNPSTH